MKNTIFVILMGAVLFSENYASASSPLCEDASQSCTHQVASLFSSGSLPVSPKAGDYTGRCFAPDDSGVVRSSAGLLKLEKSASNNEHYSFGIAEPNVDSSLLDYWDDGTRAAADDQVIPVTAATQSGNSLVAPAQTFGGNAGKTVPSPRSFFLRKNGDIFVAVLVFTSDVPAQNIKSGGIAGLCYFFKKVF